MSDGFIGRTRTQQKLWDGKLKVMNLGCLALVESGHGGFPIIYADAVRAANPRPRYSGHQWGNVSKFGIGVVDLMPFNLMLSEAAMNPSLPQHARRPLIAYGRFRPMYNFGENGREALHLYRATWWKDTR